MLFYLFIYFVSIFYFLKLFIAENERHKNDCPVLHTDHKWLNFLFIFIQI